MLLIEEIADRKEVSDIISTLGILKKSDFLDDESFNFALKSFIWFRNYYTGTNKKDELNKLELESDNFFKLSTLTTAGKL